MIGSTFDFVVVKARAGYDTNRHPLLRCVCTACGKQFTTRLDVLRRGDQKSCGCMKGTLHSATMTTHGHSKKSHPLHGIYMVWVGMHRRCEKASDPRYRFYGNIGVRVCKRWSGAKGYMRFLHDVGERPSGVDRRGRSLYSIGRFGDIGSYSPLNCKWMTFVEQCAEASTKRAARMHCKYGHRLTPENIGTRGCKMCRRESCAEYRLRRTQRRNQR